MFKLGDWVIITEPNIWVEVGTIGQIDYRHEDSNAWKMIRSFSVRFDHIKHISANRLWIDSKHMKKTSREVIDIMKGNSKNGN